MMDTLQACARLSRHADLTPPKLEIAARELGVVLEIVQLDESTASILRRDGQYGFRLLLNKRNTHQRRRWALARALAGLLIHGRAIKPEVIDKTNRASPDGPFIDRLASELLMPEPLVAALWREGEHDPAYLARAFEVTERAARKRLEDLMLIRP